MVDRPEVLFNNMQVFSPSLPSSSPSSSSPSSPFFPPPSPHPAPLKMGPVLLHSVQCLAAGSSVSGAAQNVLVAKLSAVSTPGECTALHCTAVQLYIPHQYTWCTVDWVGWCSP